MITIDAKGDNCPLPVIKTKKALEALTSAETIEVLVDNEIAVQNVTKFGTNEGGKVTSEKIAEKEFKVTIQMAGSLPSDGIDTNYPSDIYENTVAVFATDRMGEGNDELGKTLMKGFIFALTQLDALPKTLLFYNGGATLTCEDSDSLADLQAMESHGVEILTCGTCLDYYHLKDKLRVGGVTNMYSIVEILNGASKILKP